MLELRVLNYLVTVADQGTVSAAAEQLRVAQPAISRQLRSLERSVGVDLFEKKGRNLVLTAAGSQFVEVARSLLRQGAEAEAVAHRLATGSASRIIIASSLQTINEILAPALAASLTPSGPHVDFRTSLPDNAVDELDLGADLAVGAAPLVERVETEAIGRIPLLAQFLPDEQWAERTSLHIEEVLERPLILLTREHLIRRRIDDLVSAAGTTYSSVVESSVPTGAQALAAVGRGVALLTNLPMFGVRAVPLHDDAGPVEIRIHASWQRDHYAEAEIRALVGAFRESYQQRMEQVRGLGTS